MTTALHDTRRLEDATAYRVQRLARKLRYALASSLEAWGTDLSPEQFFILFRLSERDGRMQRELADPDLDDRPNITRQITALSGRGLVERRPDPDDGRVKRVHLTPQGRAFFDGLRPRIVGERERLFGRIPPADLAVFEFVLAAVEAEVLESSS